MSRSLRLLFALVLVAISPLLAAQSTTLQGALPDGRGFFRIDHPVDWRPGGPLIVYNHGFDLKSPKADRPPSTAPDSTTRELLLQQGFALAAGTYSTRGWALFDIGAAQDALLARFRETLGEPGEIILFGGSLGGLVSLKTAEHWAARGQAVAGVLAACPPLGGARTWDQALDLRLLFDAVCPDSPLPRGSDPALPWLLDYDDIPESINDIDDPDALLAVGSVANRVRQCTGMFQPAMFDTPAQRDRRDRLKSLAGISTDSFLKTQLGYAVFALSDLVLGSEKLAGFNAFDNRFVDYGDPAVNAEIVRVGRDPLAAVKMGAASDLSGRWGDARVLVVHTDRDELVVTEHLSVLGEVARDDARAPVSVVVREQAPAHCAFSRSELRASLESLVSWIRLDKPPSAGSLLDACRQLSGSERCGFDPDYVVAPLASRIPDRQLDALDHTSQHHTGAWYDPAFDGEGLVIEVLENGVDAVLTWYTYPASGQAGEQRWIAGLGRISADGIHVAEAFETRGARFGQFEASEVQYLPWGEITVAFDRCGPSGVPVAPSHGVGRMRYQASGADGSGERALFQLTHNGRFPPHCTLVGTPPPPSPGSRYSGSWFRGPAQPGEGIQFQVDRRGDAVLVWYTFDPEGNPAWLLGTAAANDDGQQSWTFDMLRPRGTRFGANFDSGAIERASWGQLSLRFLDCDQAEMRWTPTEAGWAAGEATLERLSLPAGTPACTLQ